MYLSSLIALSVLAAATRSYSAQVPLGYQLDTPLVDAEGGRLTGVLKRFEANGSHDTSYLLHEARAWDLDVWHATPAHVDIYFPSSAPHEVAISRTPTSSRPIYMPENAPRNAAVREDQWTVSLENSTFHAAYHPLFETETFLRALVNRTSSNATDIKAEMIGIGRSALKREMYALRIAKGSVAKDAFVILGAQHAREWIATSTSLYLAHALLADPSETSSLARLLDTFEFHIIPSPNPDGYDYTWESDRFWYKNRQPNHSNCTGLDMNRNWAYKWKATGPEHEPCSHWYPGPVPFSSPEVRHIAEYFKHLTKVGTGRIEAFVDLRAYGQMMAGPYSFSCDRLPAAAEDQLEAAHGAANALRLVHGTEFQSGSLCELLYRAPGNVVDWVYQKARVKYAYAAFLRDTGTYGFVLPPEWIRPVGEETAGMIAYLAQFIRAPKK